MFLKSFIFLNLIICSKCLVPNLNIKVFSNKTEFSINRNSYWRERGIDQSLSSVSDNSSNIARWKIMVLGDDKKRGNWFLDNFNVSCKESKIKVNSSFVYMIHFRTLHKQNFQVDFYYNKSKTPVEIDLKKILIDNVNRLCNKSDINNRSFLIKYILNIIYFFSVVMSLFFFNLSLVIFCFANLRNNNVYKKNEKTFNKEKFLSDKSEKTIDKEKFLSDKSEKTIDKESFLNYERMRKIAILIFVMSIVSLNISFIVIYIQTFHPNL